MPFARPFVLIALISGALYPACGASLVQNGSLEDLNSSFVNTSANYMSLLANSIAIANWTVSPGTTNEIVWAKSPTSDGHNAANGIFFVDLTGFGGDSPNGAIQQALQNLIVGQSYSFSMIVEVGGSLPKVTAGAVTVALVLGAPFVVGIDTWTPATGTFLADSTNPVLKIANQSPGQQVTFVDNIAVTGPSSVPEPAGTLLIVTAIAGLGFLRRRNRR